MTRTPDLLWIALAAWLGVAGPRLAPAEEISAPEYTLKAAFLYHFTKFTRWPEGAFDDATSPFVIGVLGDDPFGPLLDQTIAGKTVQDRPLEIRRFKRIEELGRCHLLFVSASERKSLSQVFAALQGKPVLTVGDAPEFLEQGGMIGFVIRDERVQFEIRPERADRVGLRFSSQLLKLVKDGKNHGRESL
jgi:uncharacterized protein DUF4154